jgi:hypothetical protein
MKKNHYLHNLFFFFNIKFLLMRAKIFILNYFYRFILKNKFKSSIIFHNFNQFKLNKFIFLKKIVFF